MTTKAHAPEVYWHECHAGMNAKRGRPLGSGKKAASDLQRRHDFALLALRELLGARPFRDGIALIGMSDAQAGFDSLAFQWTQAYTAGMLKRLDEGSV